MAMSALYAAVNPAGHINEFWVLYRNATLNVSGVFEDNSTPIKNIDRIGQNFWIEMRKKRT